MSRILVIKMGPRAFSADEMLDIFRANAEFAKKENRPLGGDEILELRGALKQEIDTHIEKIKARLDKRLPVSPESIDDVKTLERLALYATHGYQDDLFVARLRKFESGIIGTLRTQWVKLESRAIDEQLLSGDYLPERKFDKVSFRPR